MTPSQKARRTCYSYKMPWGRWLTIARDTVYGPIARVYLSDDGTPYGRARFLWTKKKHWITGKCIARVGTERDGSLCGERVRRGHYCPAHGGRP